jgi:hypothetical protein
MIFEQVIDEALLIKAKSVLGPDIVFHRIHSLYMPARECFKMKDKIALFDNLPFTNSVGEHNKEYKLNYGALHCETTKTFNINGKEVRPQFILYTTYCSEWGEIVILVAKRHEISRIRLFFYHTNKKNNIKDLTVPILDKDTLHKITSNTVDFVGKAKKRKLTVQRGLLLYGQPGNGKSMATGYIEKRAKNEGLSVAKIVEPAKVSEDNLAEVNILDDVDLNLFSRASGGNVTSKFLSAMSGTDKDKRARCFIFTTNEDISGIDPAFLRPERIDLAIEMQKPDMELRRRLILEYWEDFVVERVQSEGCLEWLIKHTEGSSFAEINAIQTVMFVYDLDDKVISVKDAAEEAKTDMKLKSGLNKTSKKVGWV